MQTKKQYVKPTLKEHGVVRDLTQKSGSGGRGPQKNKIKGPHKNPPQKH
ncbi:MAG TPA: lasso RiPP family leader peptide-containing protein [Anaerolineales bacterium]|nr:lasso RiPP family leader peptide-containing protein [Anaerolineales bacterium]